MRLINVSTKKFPAIFTMVDDQDFDYLENFKWHVESYRGKLYVRGRPRDRHLEFIHRVILSAPPEFMVDHKDMNPLNNQKSNLRLCTRTQNLRNQKKHACGKTSIFKGVYKVKENGKFAAAISVDNKSINLGVFEKEIDAATAYNNGAIKYHGEFARLNIFPPAPLPAAMAKRYMEVD